jgi:hypothetical protein
VEWTSWIALLKQYGPLGGLFIGYVIWQTVQINKLLDRNSAIYEGEIARLATVQQQLLTHILGPQPSSTALPNIKDLQGGPTAKPDAEK